MQRKKGDLLRLKKRASESSAMEGGPSKRHAPHQGFRPLASVSASTRWMTKLRPWLCTSWCPHGCWH